jgi:REP element-mobilizing transposase RayT
MSSPRIVLPDRAFYHCVSRVVDKRIVFHAGEKEVFRSILRKLETFCGVRVSTYCLMGNHFHLLVEVPRRDSIPPLTAESLIPLLRLLYDKATVQSIATQLESARKSGNPAREREILERFERRRGDLSIFLKELKQRVSIFLNRRLGRCGTLWEGRFKSVLVEGGEAALHAVAAYIDLNPVRAGLVARPEDYRWSGYGEAMGSGKGAKRARKGLDSLQREALTDPERGGSEVPWSTVRDRYRRLLYLEGRERPADEPGGSRGRKGIATAEVEAVVEEGARLTLPEVLRRKVRYFCDGAVLGSEVFVEEAFEGLKSRGRIGPRRETGARRLRGADWGELRVLRDLQVRVIDPPVK